MSFMGEVTPMAALRNGPWLALTGNGRASTRDFILLQVLYSSRFGVEAIGSRSTKMST